MRWGSPLDTWTCHGYSEEEARIIIAWLVHEKKRLLRQARKRVGKASEKQNLPRHARNVIQRKASKYKRPRTHSLPKSLLVSQYRDVNLLNGIFPERGQIWKSVIHRPILANPPTIKFENFSFVNNPVGTMEMLAEFVRTECLFTQARLDFLDAECLDIGPYLVLQALRQHIAAVYLGGAISVELQHVIDAVGLRAALQMAPFKQVKDQTEVWPFRLRQRRPSNSSMSVARQLEPQTKESVADEFIVAVDKWLSVVAQQELTLDGRRLVQKMVGEALDNAERHSQPNSNDGEWAMTGYLVKRGDAQTKDFRIHMAMLSVGATIEESILSGPPDMLKRMNSYVARHRSRSQSEEALRTVFALQDGVTKDRDAAAEGRGGTGFQDIFTFFSDLGATNSPLYRAELVIISGNTCIKLFWPYLCGVQKGGDPVAERELWFNQGNSPEFAPAPSNVFLLPCRLNGTLVSMAIPLDRTYLEATVDDSN